MANIQPLYPESAKPPRETQETGGILPGGFPWVIQHTGGIAKWIAEQVAKFLAEIKVMTELLKKEQAVQDAVSNYQAHFDNDPDHMKKYAKAIMEALEALKKFTDGGYKGIITGMGKRFNLPPKAIQEALAATKGLIHQTVYGTGKGQTNIVSVLERLTQGISSEGKAAYDKALKNWLEGKPGSEKSFEAQLAGALMGTMGGDGMALTQFQLGWQNLLGTASDVGKVLQAQLGLKRGSLEALYQGMSKIAAKAFSTIQQMIRLTGGV